MLWNELEAFQDMVFCNVLNLPREVQNEVTSRINGFDGKQQIIRACMEKRGLFTEKIRVIIASALDAAASVKVARDNIIHAKGHDHDKGTAETMRRRGEVIRVDISSAALSVTLDHLVAVSAELAFLSGVTDPKFWTKKQRRGQEFQEWLAQAQAHQTKRKSLPPLPTPLV